MRRPPKVMAQAMPLSMTPGVDRHSQRLRPGIGVATNAFVGVAKTQKPQKVADAWEDSWNLTPRDRMRFPSPTFRIFPPEQP